MSTEIKTEKPTWVFPSARKTPTSFSTPASLEWVYDIPPGKMLAGFIFDAKVTTVGAGMSLTRISQYIQKFRAFADGKLALDIDQYTMDLCPIVTQWSKHHDDYADLTFTGASSTSSTVLVQDDINVATGAALYGFWHVAAPLPVKNQIKFILDTYGGQTVFGAGMTGGVPEFSIVPVFANIGQRKQYNLYAKRLSSILRVSYRGVEVGVFGTTSEWNTISNGVKLGGELSPEQIYANQSIQGNAMAAFAPKGGSVVNGRLAGFKDPLPDTGLFTLANKFDGQAAVDLSFTTATDVKAVILSEADPDSIEVR